ncbi:MAG: hypothetical protein WBW62_05955 [Solirubrobacterales bacterium]
MSAEILKIRSMPTPRWCLVAVLFCFLIGLVSTIIWGTGGDDSGIIDLAVGFPLSIASIVFGVWIFGVEFGQNTVRRTLTADPRRGRLIMSKILAVVFFLLIVTVLFHLVAWPLFDLAAARHDQSISAEEVFRAGLASMLINLVYATVGMAFSLLVMSMAGGMTIALVFIFIIDSIIPAIPKVGDFAMGPALAKLTDNIRGYESDIFGVQVEQAGVVAVVIVAAWVLGLLALGTIRLMRSDIK